MLKVASRVKKCGNNNIKEISPVLFFPKESLSCDDEPTSYCGLCAVILTNCISFDPSSDIKLHFTSSDSDNTTG